MDAPNLFLAVDLRARRFWLATGWVLVLLVVYLSLTPAPIELEIEQGDKFSHVLAYLVLMSWFANLFEGGRRRVGFALGFVLLGVGLEFAQGFVGYRSFEVIDMAANATGVACGWFLATPRVPNYFGLVERIWHHYS